MKYFALIDCNNFYASCERIFNPSLQGRPLIVLSNNDGCVIARSKEAKNLGIGMGEPFFKIQEICERLKISVHSSNYTLYGDISQRVMNILTSFAEDIEVYSIDEAFITFSEQMTPQDVLAKCIKIKNLIQQWVGIPVSIGISFTKTLAKIATSQAKESKAGVFSITTKEVHHAILKDFPVENIWGIGRGIKSKLHARNIHTAWKLYAQEPASMRRLLGVIGERIVWELRGKSCLALEKPGAKQSITSSRSFGKTLDDPSQIAEALSTYVNKACIKLRKQNSCTRALYVYLEARVNNDTGKCRHVSMAMDLQCASSDTPHLISAAKQCLKQLYRPNERYKKCGVILLDLIPKTQIIPDFFLETIDKKRDLLAETFDFINARFGKNTLFYAAMGVDNSWKMRQEKRSNRYTTQWNELATAKA